MEYQVLSMVFSGLNFLGIGGIFKWVISVERRLTSIETTCKNRNAPTFKRKEDRFCYFPYQEEKEI